MTIKYFLCLILICVCTNSYGSALHTQLIDDLNHLASNALMGRKTATEGAANTRAYLHSRLSKFNLNVSEQTFTYKSGIFEDAQGINIIAVPTKSTQRKKIIITAHYDHLGKRGGKYYFGANDNATGVAALLYLASSLQNKEFPYELVFVLTDAEENGLHGSKHFAQTLNSNNVLMNINLDMLGVKKHKSRVYALTSYSLKQKLKPVFTALNNTKITIKPVYSSKQMNRLIKSQNIDWHKASDHYSFAQNNIPYVYFGMGHDPHHHTTKDTVQHIDIPKYVSTVLAIEGFIKQLAHHHYDDLNAET
ncbi:MAG: M28 family peptidase [Colwellia sp.]|nr:M28 family peptidase [Colwellia sp.]